MHSRRPGHRRGTTKCRDPGIRNPFSVVKQRLRGARTKRGCEFSCISLPPQPRPCRQPRSTTGRGLHSGAVTSQCLGAYANEAATVSMVTRSRRQTRGSICKGADHGSLCGSLFKEWALWYVRSTRAPPLPL